MIATAFLLGCAVGAGIVWLSSGLGRLVGRRPVGPTAHRACWDSGCHLSIGHIGPHRDPAGSWWR